MILAAGHTAQAPAWLELLFVLIIVTVFAVIGYLIFESAVRIARTVRAVKTGSSDGDEGEQS